MRQDIAGPETESTMPLWEGLDGSHARRDERGSRRLTTSGHPAIARKYSP